MTHILLRRVRWLRSNGCDNLRDEYEVGRTVLSWQRDHDELAPHGLGVACECAAGHGCGAPAICDEEGVPLCAGCLEGAVWSEDGDSDCRECGSGEHVVWDGSVGADGAYVYDDAPENPPESPDGEWAVVDMDGTTIGIYASEQDADDAITAEAARFRRGSVHGSRANSYLPRSVIHLPCGRRRAAQWSTSYYSPGCTHAEGADEIEDEEG